MKPTEGIWRMTLDTTKRDCEQSDEHEHEHGREHEHMIAGCYPACVKPRCGERCRICNCRTYVQCPDCKKYESTGKVSIYDIPVSFKRNMIMVRCVTCDSNGKRGPSARYHGGAPFFKRPGTWL